MGIIDEDTEHGKLHGSGAKSVYGSSLLPINEGAESEEHVNNVIQSKLHAQKEKIYYEAFLVVLPLFCGYATLFSLQSEVKKTMGIDQNSSRSALFGTAVSMLYIGNLFFRLGHNFFFFFGTPRIRVLISMGSMVLAMTILSFVMFVFQKDTSMVWIFLSYGLGGVAIGSFESNILSTISGTHPTTKLWAIIAMPVGINIITIGAFLLLGTYTFNAGYVHISVAIMVVLGIGVFLIRLFRLQMSMANRFSLMEFLRSYLYWNEWLWFIRWNCISLMFDMFCVSLFSPGVELYIYNGDTVPFYGYNLNRDWYLSIYNACFFLGDTSSRKLLNMIHIVNPFYFLMLSAIGISIGLSGVPEIVPLCGFLVAFANGSIYVQSTMVIGSRIPDAYNLVSLSTWLFVGDIGSVVGSNLITYIVNWVT